MYNQHFNTKLAGLQFGYVNYIRLSIQTLLMTNETH